MNASKAGVFRGAVTAAEADIDTASKSLELLEWLNAKRTHGTVEDNRPAIARSIGVSATAVERIRHRRRKTIPSWIMTAIRSRVLLALQTEIDALEHELAICRHLSAEDEIGAAAAALENARAILERATAPG